MHYWIFDTQDSAQNCINFIDRQAMMLYASMGYTIDAHENIIGKAAGVDESLSITSTWAKPAQRIDGKWVVPHVDNKPDAQISISGSDTIASLLASEILAPVENDTINWWPQYDQPSSATV